MRCMQGDDRIVACMHLSYWTQADAFTCRVCLRNYLILKYLFKLQKGVLVCMNEKQKLQRFLKLKVRYPKYCALYN